MEPTQLPQSETFHSSLIYPAYNITRTIPCYFGAEAVLMRDSCGSYVTSEIFKILGENHVKIVAFASYTTNLFQALDWSFFGVLKQKKHFGCGNITMRFSPQR
jgi:hypothetical protein